MHTLSYFSVAFNDEDLVYSGNLILSHQDPETATVKIVFPPAAFQLLYSVHARVNTMKEGLPWLSYIW